MESLKCGDGVQQETAVATTATEEVDEFIDQNIQINSNKQMREEYLYSWTLKFKDDHQEVKYCQLREDMFRSNMLCVYVVWIFIVLCQAIIVPRCTLLVICLAVSTLLLTAGCILVMAEEFAGLPVILRKSSAILVHHRNRRTMFICSVIVLKSIACSIGLFLCPMAQKIVVNDGNVTITNTTNVTATPMQLLASHMIDDRDYDTQIQLKLLISARIQQRFGVNGTNTSADSLNELVSLEEELSKITANETNEFSDHATAEWNDTIIDDHYDFFLSPPKNYNAEMDNGISNPIEPDADSIKAVCLHPEYMVFTWVLCLIALATGLKLYYLVKTCMAFIMVCYYATLILVIFPDVFSQSIDEAEYAQLGMPLSAQMNILLIVFLTMVTYHARLVEVTSRLDFIWKEQAEKELTNMKSNRILNDLLIKNILPDHVASYYLSDGRSDELYAKMHNMCGVMFASIPNFQDFYSEDIENGKACIRILNEIICDFDSLMDEPQFATVEKIKTVGATYMAASGLNPKNQVRTFYFYIRYRIHRCYRTVHILFSVGAE